MARREYHVTLRCAHEGCDERSFWLADTRAEQNWLFKKAGEWLCTRHTKPDEVLMPANPAREHVLVATELFSDPSRYGRDAAPTSLGLFWVPEGKESGSGFTYGPGFKAFTKDFPEGTRLVVTARVEIPDSAENRGTGLA